MFAPARPIPDTGAVKSGRRETGIFRCHNRIFTTKIMRMAYSRKSTGGDHFQSRLYRGQGVDPTILNFRIVGATHRKLGRRACTVTRNGNSYSVVEGFATTREP